MEPYDPCPPSSAAASGCLDLAPAYCENFSESCSTGFCFTSGDSIPVNAGIPTSGIVENKVIYIDRIYTIAGGNIKFVNCKFKMYAGAGISVRPFGSTSAPVSIEFDHCDFFSCNVAWRGITVSVPGQFSYSTMHHFNFHDCHVEGAKIGLYLSAGTKQSYSIFDNVFRNNATGIRNVPGPSLGQNTPFYAFNAVVAGNEFYVDHPLSVPLPALVGIELERVAATIGVLGSTKRNYFHCLLWGVRASGCVTAVNNSIFEDMVNNNGFYSYGKGIEALDGSLKVESCNFSGDAGNFVEASGANLTVLSSTFSTRLDVSVIPNVLKSPVIGIYSHGNAHGEVINIGEVDKGNTFEMADDRWTSGIQIERTAGVARKTSCQVKYNDFTVSGNVASAACILVNDALTPVSDGIRIAWNTIFINVPGIKSTVHGIHVRLSQSKNYTIDNNTVSYENDQSDNAGWGIALEGTGGLNNVYGNKVSNNTVTGNAVGSHVCSIHCFRVTGTELCENTVDGGMNGLHCPGANSLVLRENHMNYHQYGILIDGAQGQISPQKGRGNTWLEDADACSIKAAAVSKNGEDPTIPTDPFRSQFVVSNLEGSALPFLPPANKIEPNPTMIKWFINDTATLNYCNPITMPRPPRLPPYEQREIDGDYNSISSVSRWDIQRSAYTQMLMDTLLRPASSPEATWFNALVSSNIAAFAEVEKGMIDALAFSSADEQQLDSMRTLITGDWTEIDNLDTTHTFSSTYLTQRDSFLALAASHAGEEDSTEVLRQAALVQGLQDALTANSAISDTSSYETALKQLNHFCLQRLLGEPLDSIEYAQIVGIGATTRNNAWPHCARCSAVARALRSGGFPSAPLCRKREREKQPGICFANGSEHTDQP